MAINKASAQKLQESFIERTRAGYLFRERTRLGKFDWDDVRQVLGAGDDHNARHLRGLNTASADELHPVSRTDGERARYKDGLIYNLKHPGARLEAR